SRVQAQDFQSWVGTHPGHVNHVGTVRAANTPRCMTPLYTPVDIPECPPGVGGSLLPSLQGAAASDRPNVPDGSREILAPQPKLRAAALDSPCQRTLSIRGNDKSPFDITDMG